MSTASQTRRVRFGAITWGESDGQPSEIDNGQRF